MLKHDAHVAVGVGGRLGVPVVLRPEGAGDTGDLAWQKWGRFGRKIAARCHHADAVVAISSTIERELIEDAYEVDRIVRLPNGVPVPDRPWRPREDWRVAPRAVFVGRLAREKGLDTLIDAWEVVRRAHRHAHLTILGEGTERAALESRVGHLGLGDSVTFAGPTADPSSTLEASDLFVLPSREEGMSIALLEAMALGMPIVVSAVPGNRQVLVDFRHGRLAPPNHPLALAEAIVEQWGNYDRAIHMGEAARDLVRREYSIEEIARRHLALFRDLIARKRARAERR